MQEECIVIATHAIGAEQQKRHKEMDEEKDAHDCTLLNDANDCDDVSRGDRFLYVQWRTDLCPCRAIRCGDPHRSYTAKPEQS